jgi:phage terminase large subunit-like protein
LPASAPAVMSVAYPPRIEIVPPYSVSAAPEVHDLLRMVGMPMLPWQSRFLDQMLAENDQGMWAASEVALIVPRQNGKSYVLAARILASLFLTGEDLITYTAHRVDTALEVFNLVDRLARSHPDLEKMMKSTTRTGGKETITMRDGRRFKIVARSRATGRGFTGDCIIFDEALELRDQSALNAMMPTLATRPNAQVVYASSAGDSGSVVLAGIRDRAMREHDPDMCFVEYSADKDADPDDEIVLLAANPGAPDLISMRAIRNERKRMSIDGFRQERMGVWAHELARTVIPPVIWKATTRSYNEQPQKRHLGIAFDVASDRSWSAIVAAWRVGETVHVRTSQHRQSDNWLVKELIALSERYECKITYDATGPGRDIGEALQLADVDVDPVSGRDFATSCARFLSGLSAQTITHHPDAPMAKAAEVATSRAVGEGWVFARRHASVPICSLTAATLAVWAVDHRLTPVEPRIW